MQEVIRVTEVRPSVLIKRAKRRISSLLERPDLSDIPRGRNKMKDKEKLTGLLFALSESRGTFTVDQEFYILSQVAGISARFQEKDRVAEMRKKNWRPSR